MHVSNTFYNCFAAGISSEGGDREFNGDGVLMMSEGACSVTAKSFAMTSLA